MSPEGVAWGVALALVGLGGVGVLRGDAIVPECAAPRLVRDDGGVALVRCDGVGGESVAGAVGLLYGVPIDLNRAGVRDLTALPGIGPARATAIVAARERSPFCSPEEIVRAHGVGPRTAAELRGWTRASCGEASR